MSRPAFVLPHLVRDGLDPDPAFRPSTDQTDPGVVGLPGPDGLTIWLVLRHAAVRQVLADHGRFSSAALPWVGEGHDEDNTDGGSGEPAIEQQSLSLLTTDPPEHTRLRRMLSAEFTVKRVRWVQPRITAIVEHCLDEMEAAGSPAELVSAFALPVPSLVICELLGVPYEDRDRFQVRTARSSSSTTAQEERDANAREQHEYMGSLVDHARSNPGDDVLGMLVRDHGDDLSRTELIDIANLLLFAGHETTASMLGLGTLALLRHPDQLARIRDDPTVVESAVEELLRHLSVLQMSVPRTATQDTEISGQKISRGDLVMVSLSIANRDPDLLDDPDTLDITRQPVPHLAFGHGIHHCLGAQLARAEMQIAWPALLQRFPTLGLDPTHEVEYRSPDVFYGVASLPVIW